MAYKPSSQQQAAISAGKGRYLVAAGAGSGKTEVLSLRTVELIKTGQCKLGELLVLTFGNDAAASMKKRILEKLSAENDHHCKEAARSIDSASVMTFDALAYRIVSSYAHLLGLSSSIAIDADGILDFECQRLIDSYSEELSGKKDAKYLSLLWRYCYKTADPIKNYVLDLYKASLLSPDPLEWLSKEVPGRFLTPGYYRECEESIRQWAIGQLAEIISDCHDLLSFESDYRDAFAFVPEDLSLAYRKSLEEGNGFQLAGRYPTCGKAMEEAYPGIKGISESLKARVAAVQKKTKLLGGHPEELEEEFLASKDDISFLCGLAARLYRDMAAVMENAGLYGFNDIYHMALEAMDNPEINRDFAGKYKFIMVDEYQDTSDLQQSFIDKLGISNVFYVGDVKQSIYGFRHANPKYFSKLSGDYAGKKDGTLLRMTYNFRSREEVLEGINGIFASFMSEGLGGVDYADGQALDYGNKSYSPSSSLERYGIETVSVKDDGKSPLPCYRYIAEDIARKLTSGFRVFSKDEAGGGRPCRPGDFAVLCMTRNNYDDLIKELESRHVPYVSDAPKGLGDSDVLMALSSLAKFYLYLDEKDNLDDLRHSYASIRRSFLYMDSDEDIWKALCGNAFLNGDFARDVRQNRAAFLKLSLPEAVRYLSEHHGFREGLLRVRGLKKAYASLYSIYGVAESFERLGYGLEKLTGLPGFLREQKSDLGGDKANMDLDAVKIYTIHKSKGLEFPLVYIGELEHRFNFRDFNVGKLADCEYGVALEPYDTSLAFAPSVDASIKKRAGALSEYIRLFYVALTRTKEKLVLVETDVPDRPNEYGKAWNIRCFRDLLELAGIKAKEASLPFPGGETSYVSAFAASGTGTVDLIKAKPVGGSEKSARYSKESLFVDEWAAERGTMLHSLMQLVDFATLDCSFVADLDLRSSLERALALPPFREARGYKAYKEYGFVDETGREGSIDLLLLGKDRAVVIDYKSSNIDDPHYDDQVNGYRKIVEGLFGLPTSGYLVSLTQGRYKVVE